MKVKLENTTLLMEIEKINLAKKEYHRKNLELQCEIQNKSKKINIFSKQRGPGNNLFEPYAT